MEWKIPSMMNNKKGKSFYVRKREKEKSNKENERNNPSATIRDNI
jgi:hypothetical protein